MTRRWSGKRWRLLPFVPALALGACSGEPDAGPSVGEIAEEIINGTVTTIRPAVGWIGTCTAVLISPTYFITAAHCIGYEARKRGGLFTVTLSSPPPPAEPEKRSFSVNAIYSFNGNPLDPDMDNGVGRYDIAIGRLSQSVDADVATPAVIANREPVNGETVTAIGFGCDHKPPPDHLAPVKRLRTFTWPPVDIICPGDSGAPTFAGDASANGELLGIGSAGSRSAGSHDTLAFPGSLKLRIEALIRSLDDGFQEPLEPGTDRPGGDLAGMPEFAADAPGCRDHCAQRFDCRAFSFTAPSQCRLKGTVPAVVANAAVTSAVMLDGLELGLDRAGSDLTSFVTADGAIACRNECTQRRDCLAFSFVVSTNTCFLKGRAPRITPKAGVTSGLSLTQGPFSVLGPNVPQVPGTIGGSADLCEADCARNVNCGAYDYHASNQTCRFKLGVTTAVPCQDCRSGIRKSLEPGTNRAGGDLPGMPLTGITSAETCQLRCVHRNECRAFTWVQAAQTCWLKGFAPPPGADAGMVSGVRRGIEVNVDRPGSDLTSVDLADPLPEECQHRCEASSACKAWTLYTKPSGAFVNRCVLKSGVPASQPVAGVFSGRKGMFSF